MRCARQVFDEMPQPTLSVYNYMISGYIKNGQVLESLDLIRRLNFSGKKPDGFTYSMILKATTSGSVLELEAGFGEASACPGDEI